MTVRTIHTLSILMLCSVAFVSADQASVVKDAQKAQKEISSAVKKAEQKVAVVSDVVDKNVASPVISTYDQIIGMSQSELGKEEQVAMEKLQTDKASVLESDRKTLDDRLKQFNAKKDTLSEDARKKEEQELMAASGDLQNKVRKAQEEIRAEMGKATERLAKVAEEAAAEVAKAENVDVLLEKNTGRVIYTKNGTDLTDKIQRKMNEKTKLAKAKAPAKPAQKAA
jgi:outer membrane protein